jgi:hypothetical protein
MLPRAARASDAGRKRTGRDGGRGLNPRSSSSAPGRCIPKLDSGIAFQAAEKISQRLRQDET